jgi:hypothetical protein
MNTGQAIDFIGPCSWFPGSRAEPAPRNDAVPAFFRSLLEALNGMLLFGLTTTFLFAMIQEVWQIHRDR